MAGRSKYIIQSESDGRIWELDATMCIVCFGDHTRTGYCDGCFGRHHYSFSAVPACGARNCLSCTDEALLGP